MTRVISNRGEEMTLILTGVGLDEVVTASSGDITGCTFAAQIRRFADASAVLATIDVEIEDAESGTVSMSLDAATAQALDFDRAKWSMTMTDADGNVSEVFYGDVYYTPEVTR